MRGIVIDHAAPGHFAVQHMDEPVCASDEALVQVSAVSLNQSEVVYAHLTPAGTHVGMDLAGIVLETAADGSGPSVGTRVVGLVRAGAWAETVAVPTNAIAALPAAVSFADAATLPVAGLTALHAIERGTGLLGRTVLVTGASGGLGLFACQLAHLAGADVVGVVRRESTRDLVHAVGADQVVVAEDGAAAASYGPYRLIIESVGGQMLGSVLGMLGPDGVCVTVGASAGRTFVPLDPLAFLMTGRASLYGLLLWNEVARESAATGLERLTRLMATGRLRASIAIEAPLEQAGSIGEQLLERRWSGKGVLRMR